MTRRLLSLADPLAVYEKIEDAGRTVRALVDRGKLYALARKQDPANQDLANQDLERALVVARRAQSASDEAFALEFARMARDLFDDQAAAVPLYQSALEKYRTSRDSLSVGRVLEWMATQQEIENRHFDGAVDAYRQAAESYLVAGDTVGAARVTMGAARVKGQAAISRTVQWGFLVDLKRAKLFAMRGDRITVGRDTPGINNDLSFASNFVSRRHLVVSYDGYHADDVRSLNGTTINATQLPYGLGKQLADGDIITLANTEVLQFTTQRPSLPAIPPSAWAIFIDGPRRNFFYLTETMYSVDVTPAGVTIEKGESASTLKDSSPPGKTRSIQCRGRVVGDLFRQGERLRIQAMAATTGPMELRLV